MLHTITKRLEKCCDIDTEVELLLESLEITFFLNKHFFLQMAYELLSQSRKLNKLGGGGGGSPNKRGDDPRCLGFHDASFRTIFDYHPPILRLK